MIDGDRMQEARELLADVVEEQGSAWANTAGLIRGGFENLWLKPALVVIEGLLARIPADD